MAWFKKPRHGGFFPLKRREMPDGLWTKCDGCGEIVYNKELEENLRVCPKCNYHSQINARERLSILIDEETFQEYDQNMESVDILNFTDSKKYSDRLKEAQEKTGLKEAVITGEGKIEDRLVGIGILDFRFLGGSMASVVGEKITRTVEKTLEKKLPFITVSSSGGARMQEGIISLMQMAKTSAALGRFAQAGLPHISILADPATGGVMASFGSLGDIIIAEPKALIGFAGPRVIKQTIRQELPGGFQSAEFLLEHGMVDMVVSRKELKSTLSRILAFFPQI